MSSPRVIVQIAIEGAKILGKAFAAAGRQAAQSGCKVSTSRRAGGDIAGVGNATSGSATDRLTRELRMTVDEARLILNTKKEDPMEKISQHYEHLFKANSPPAAPPKTTGKQAVSPFHSIYLQSKVFRARERLEAESSSHKLSSRRRRRAAAASSIILVDIVVNAASIAW
ncbi:Mitochondrial import inner membrane translocase subunit tim16 [Grifola frondosa]|uniref:Mitochondrial import inner membrane translocase subunit TIM16 n=1 Tax=Grifola frondosa TaxID=5627 RepID=A0A1C7M2D3_GRIFR|nr:Mitochondrial import inner membrane translocase subunit tim16 [Grifola frondosa]